MRKGKREIFLISPRIDFSLFDLSPIAIAIFFLCLMVLISEFNDFDQWVLMILISGF